MEGALSRAEGSLERRYRLRARGYDFEKVVKRGAEVPGMDRAGVLSSGKYEEVQPARGLLYYWAVMELGMKQEELSGRLRNFAPAGSQYGREAGRKVSRRS